MIPQLVTLRYRGSRGRAHRLWVPVVPVVLLLSPLLLLAVVGGIVACLMYDISPVRALRGLARFLWSLPGTRFELAQGRTALHVIVR